METVKRIIRSDRSLVLAADVQTFNELKSLAQSMADIAGIGAFKLGFALGYNYSLARRQGGKRFLRRVLFRETSCFLEAGDKIPADARIIENHSLKCDEAPLTGESVPVGKTLKSLGDVPVGDRKI